MKQISLFLLLAFATNNIVSQTKIAESANFILEEKGYKEKVDYKYCLYNSSKEIVKKFDNTYWFKNPNKENLIIVSKEENKEHKYSIFDINKGDFIIDWNYERISELNDSIFKLRIRNINKESVIKWVIINKKGEKLIEKNFTGYSGPSYDKTHQLIYSSNDKEIIEFFTTNGKTKYVLKGYDTPYINDGLLFVYKDNKRGIIDFKEEIIVPFEYNQLEVSYGKLFGSKNVNSKSVCEVYSDVNRTKTEFSIEGDNIEKLSYYNVNTQENVDYWLIANKAKESFFSTNYELFLSGEGDMDKNDSSYFFYWRIMQTCNDLYLMDYDFGYGEKTPILVNKNTKLLICKSHDVVFCTQNLDGNKYNNSGFTALYDPSKKATENILLFDKNNKIIPYKVYYQTGNMIVIELNDNGKSKFALSDGEGNLNFFSKLDNIDAKKPSVDRSFFHNDELFVFSSTENGKLSLSAFYLMNSSGDGLLCKTPAVFESVTKVYINEMYIHIVGKINGKQVIAFCNKDKFNYIELDKVPDMKTILYAENENPTPVKSNGKIVYINLMLELVEHQE